MSTASARDATSLLVERFGLKALVEACLVLEEGVAGAKDIEVGMMTGAGILPGPFARADERGLDEVLAALERGQSEWGEAFSPPLILRRLVAQGRLGRKTGQGFFPYPWPDEGQSRETVLLETRGELAIAWLNRPPTNAISPQMIGELADLWGEVEGRVRALVLASSSIFTFSAGADLREFAKMQSAEEGRETLELGHDFMRAMELSPVVTIAAVNSIAFGGGCELAMACDLRVAAESASLAQPEIGLGIMPGLGGTQRLPRLVGEGRALEMNLVGDPVDAYEALRIGLVNAVVPDHELFDAALAWGRKLSGQPPLAVEEIKRVSANADMDRGIEAEKLGFARVFGSEDAREGISAFLRRRRPEFKGR